jgi:surface polysaccharide O-acyltransferase-like enzyme
MHVPALESLKDNAYGIYIVHYVFVVWLQYALLEAPLHAVVKGAIVFTGALALSWAASAALRAMPVGAQLVGADRRAVAKAS